jgi:hypothetical protein
MSDTLGFLNDNIIIFYGRPGEWRKKALLKLIRHKLKMVDKLLFLDLTYSLSPDDLLGWQPDELDKMFIAYMSDEELLSFVDYLANTKNVEEKLFLVLHPFYTQGGLKVGEKEIDPLYVFFGLKSFCVNNVDIYIWFIINTAMIDPDKLPMFSIINEEVDSIIGFYKLNEKVGLKVSRREKTRDIILPDIST